jgi:CoA:oxalate CoA-transferase
LPLEGLKVVDFSQGVAGPYGTMLMADFGADVIKIEPLRGDWGRTLGTPVSETEGACYLTINRNKRSAAIDLKTPECLDLAHKLVMQADIVAHNYRPGVMARFGLDYPTLCANRPDLVYCSINGFGAEGPAVDYPSGDSTIQAWGGLMSIVGGEEDPPTRVGNVVSDVLSGMNLFQATLLALMDRQRTGRGREVSVALLDSIIAFQAPAFAEFLVTGQPPPRTGNDHPLVAPSGLFRTRDASIVFSVLQHQWADFCRFFDVPQLIDNPAFKGSAERRANRDALNDALRPLVARHSTEEALRLLRACDVSCAPVHDYAQVAADPQVIRNGLLSRQDHPVLGPVPFVRHPLRIQDMETPMRLAPTLGEHTDEILRLAGCAPAAIQRLREAGAIR